jgi:hypothetical protein
MRTYAITLSTMQWNRLKVELCSNPDVREHWKGGIMTHELIDQIKEVLAFDDDRSRELPVGWEPSDSNTAQLQRVVAPDTVHDG